MMGFVLKISFDTIIHANNTLANSIIAIKADIGLWSFVLALLLVCLQQKTLLRQTD